MKKADALNFQKESFSPPCYLHCRVHSVDNFLASLID